MKKFYWFIIILIIVLIILIAALHLTKDIAPQIIFLKDGDIIPSNICKNLDKIIFIEQTGCPACAAIKPRIEKLEKELNLNIKPYNVAIKEDRDELLSKFIAPQHVPTLIVNCKVYEGALSEEKLREVLK